MDLNVSQFLSPGRKEFVKGTLLLTGAGLFCRILGFFYRIYMSRTIGAEGLGLYNMFFQSLRRPGICRYWQFLYHLPVFTPALTAIIME